MSEKEKNELILSLPSWESFANMEGEADRPNGIIIPDFKVGFNKIFESGGVSFDMPDSEISVKTSDKEVKAPKRVYVEHGSIDSNDSNFKPLF